MRSGLRRVARQEKRRTPPVLTLLNLTANARQGHETLIETNFYSLRLAQLLKTVDPLVVQGPAAPLKYLQDREALHQL